MRRLVVLGDLVPERLRVLVLANVKESDGGVGEAEALKAAAQQAASAK